MGSDFRSAVGLGVAVGFPSGSPGLSALGFLATIVCPLHLRVQARLASCDGPTASLSLLDQVGGMPGAPAAATPSGSLSRQVAFGRRTGERARPRLQLTLRERA